MLGGGLPQLLVGLLSSSAQLGARVAIQGSPGPVVDKVELEAAAGGQVVSHKVCLEEAEQHTNRLSECMRGASDHDVNSYATVRSLD